MLLGELLQGIRVLALKPAEDLAEGQVCQGAVAEVQTVADDGEPALRQGLSAHLAKQPRLADAGIAAEQDQARPPRVIDL